ncbi:MAG: hypothetical protein RIG82_08415 [Phycisphaeraceae bacterium]
MTLPPLLSVAERFANLKQAGPVTAVEIAEGRWSDLRALSAFHYRSGKPATATRILSAFVDIETAGDRWLGREVRRRAVAVLVESLPALSCHLRDHALADRFGSWLPAGERARWLNEEVRCISRVIVHPQFRGLGLAVRLVRSALGSATTPVTEALAAMGRVNPFFEKAGMAAYRRAPLACDQRLLDALEHQRFVRTDLARPARLMAAIEALPEGDQAWLLKEVDRWYAQNAGRTGRRHSRSEEKLVVARSRVLVEPVYYVHLNGQKDKE